MKIQCSCGAKYAFEVTPEQVQGPIRFVCPACGVDSSELVANLIRQQFASAAEGAGAVPPVEVAPPPGPVTPESVAEPPTSAAPVKSPQAQPAVRLHRAATGHPATEPSPAGVEMCFKHSTIPATEHCRVCHNPICPQCMDLFGYVCSPLCRQKAELKGIRIPVFAGQKSVREAQMWRKLGWISGLVALVVAGYFGFMTWYRLFGSAPKPVFSVRSDESQYSGAAYLCGPEDGQVVFLHGGLLARHDIKEKKQIWSAVLVDPKEIQREAEAEQKRLGEQRNDYLTRNPDAEPIAVPSSDKLTKRLARWRAAELELRVVGQNIWVASPKKVVRYDWDTGKVVEELPVQGGFGGMIERGEELLRLDQRRDGDVITHVDLASGKIREEEVAQPGMVGKGNTLAGASANLPPANGAGLPVGAPGREMGKPLDPRKVEQQASSLPLPAKLALPATLSINRSQERTLAELNSDRPKADRESSDDSGEYFTLIPAESGYVQFSTKLLEKKLVTQQAMKPRPARSALDGSVTAANGLEVATEVLNEMQRDRGGDTVMIDESRYLVKLRRVDPKNPAEWQGEVTGRPAVFPLNSVNVIAARQKIIVLDKNNKKLWDSGLTYDVPAEALEGDPTTNGQGPCVERGNTLFVFDQGVLTAFDLKTGNVQWRLPSVGISGLFFDGDGMMYIDSTTASPDTIKYSRQIDLTAKSLGLIIKIDPRTGKTLWSHETGGSLHYVSGKYLYTVQGFGANDAEEDENPYGDPSGLGSRNLVRIRRLNPKNGKDFWEHSQERLPLSIHFDHNFIQLVFKKEVQVLKCGTF